jgi:hypothetical protein
VNKVEVLDPKRENQKRMFNMLLNGNPDEVERMLKRKRALEVKKTPDEVIEEEK